MKAKAVLWTAVLGSLLAAGCSGRKWTGEGEATKPLPGAAGPGESSAVAWGEAVNSLQAGLEIKGRRFETGAPIDVTVRFRNVGDKALRLFEGDRAESWRVVFTPAGSGAPPRAAWFRPWGKVSRIVSELELAEDEAIVRHRIRGRGWCFPEAKLGWTILGKDVETALNALSPGRYGVTSVYRGYQWRTGNRGWWVGTVTTGPVEIEITAKGAAAAAE